MYFGGFFFLRLLLILITNIKVKITFELYIDKLETEISSNITWTHSLYLRNWNTMKNAIDKAKTYKHIGTFNSDSSQFYCRFSLIMKQNNSFLYECRTFTYSLGESKWFYQGLKRWQFNLNKFCNLDDSKSTIHCPEVVKIQWIILIYINKFRDQVSLGRKVWNVGCRLI